MNSHPVTVIHNVNGATKTCTLSAPHIAKSMYDGGVSVTLSDFPGGPEIGCAYFTRGGIVLLSGVALGQYKPLTQPDRPDVQRAEEGTE